MLVGLKFKGLVNIDKVISSTSFYMATLYLWRISPVSGWPVLVHTLSPEKKQLPFLNQRKGKNDHRKYSTIDFNERKAAAPVGHASDWATEVDLPTCIGEQLHAG